MTRAVVTEMFKFFILLLLLKQKSSVFESGSNPSTLFFSEPFSEPFS